MFLKSTNSETEVFFFLLLKPNKKFDHEPKKAWMELKYAIYLILKKEPKS